MKITFLYNAQLHQVPHSLPIALELAAHYPEFEIDIAGASARHLQFARALAARYGLDAPVRYIRLRQPWPVRARALLSGELAPNKKLVLRANRPYLASRDALVTPERTSLFLKRLGALPHTRIIYTGHGAGDRAMAVAPEIAEFDFVLNPGSKMARRRLEHGLIRPRAYANGVYAKFDWAHRAGAAAPLFANGRPTVLYNPHFDPDLSSWPAMGWRVLEHFAASERYNLVFAPHVRLFEPPRPKKYRPFRAFLELPHLRIDLGRESSIDMSYTLAADLYMGDVSSQIAEFLVRPRPALFLDPRRIAWQDNPNYRCWTLGPVLQDIDRLDAALDDAFAGHAAYRPLQEAYFAESFDGAGCAPSARLGADAIARFLRGERVDA